ncbi:MAG TPA: bacterial Ig-like domain-containing protein [Bacilli bacterium]
MRNNKRLIAFFVSLLLVFSLVPVSAFAADETAGMINIASDWQGSVFGDVGGQDKINAENFSIVESAANGFVTISSRNDRGKIASGSEGIAYYYKQISPSANFQLSATAHVDAWKANNQVSFGIMLRSNVLQNESASFTGDYVAVGALDQVMKGFTKADGKQVKTGFEFSSASIPGKDEQYSLSIKKSGNLYLIRVGDETKVIESDSALAYVGLFTARNTTVTYSDVKLTMEPEVPLGSWQFSAFGSNTGRSGATPKNPDPVVNDDGSVTIAANGGKISSSVDGISFYYKEIPATVSFEVYGKATVNYFGANNQVSFGLMLRDEVGIDGDTSGHTANYVGVGGLDQIIEGFYKNGSQTKLPILDAAVPAAGETYDFSIKKIGDAYIYTVNGISNTIVQDDIFSGSIFAGIYVARDAEVTFSDFGIRTDARAPSVLNLDTSGMKTVYLVGESLDLNGLVAKAKYADGSEEYLLSNEYAVTGFDSSSAGTNTITLYFNGKTATIDLQILPLTVTNMAIKYYPAKTDYYLGDVFDPQGLVVVADYNTGVSAELTADKYAISIADATVTGATYTFDSPGAKTVRINSLETPGMSAAFEVTVRNAAISGLEIRQMPAKTQYFIGDRLDLAGMVVYAQYSDGSETRLLRGEYAVSPLDSASAGDKEVTVSYKGLTATFHVNVKVKKAVRIEVTQYPKTTYTIGEGFNSLGLIVSKVFDNQDKETLAAGTDYSIDTSAFDRTAPGVYDIVIKPADQTLSPITLPVTVREKAEYEWKWTRFGQSTSKSKNTFEDLGSGVYRLTALEGGGKITGDHDGITFYYTVLDAVKDNFTLSADIKVIEYAKSPQDGQESFGIMARDAIGVDGDSSIFASNIAAVGGYSGGTTADNGTQLFVRTGVTTPDGAGSQGIQKIMLKNERPAPNNTYPNAEYRLTLAKTNSGFIGRLNDGLMQLIFTPEIMNVQDGKMYVGFYTARLATIEVSNIDFSVTAAETDAPRMEPPAAPVAPQVEILSRDKSAETAYDFMAKTNVNGTATLKLGQSVLAQNVAVQAGQVLSIPTTLAAQTTNNFSLTFIPDDTQYLTSYDKQIINFSVNMKTYQEGKAIYVAPTGTSLGTGSMDDPLDLDTAIAFVSAGQTIIVQDGIYSRDTSLIIDKFNDGTALAMKSLVAAPGASPVIDFNKKSEGVVHSGNYWHVKGIAFTHSAPNTKGYTIGGSHNIIEQCKFYENGDTGLQISRTDITENDKAKWPSYNLILNSESFDNMDPSQNNADGFAAKLTSGEGNVFRGDISHNNIDDGWDLYTKAGSGAIGAVLIEDCIAYHNGTLSDGTVGKGDKNGFKLGGEGIYVSHIIRNSLAFGNGAAGFTSNSNPGVIAENNISFNNGGSNLSFTTYTNIPEDFTINGFVSYRTEGTAKDNFPSRLKANNNYFFDGAKSVNLSGITLTDNNFASLTPALPYQRDENGDIIRGDFLRFLAPTPASSSDSSSVSPSQTATTDLTGNEDGSVTLKAPVKVDNGTATVTIDGDTVKYAVSQAVADERGQKIIRIDFTQSEANTAKTLAVNLPAEAFAQEATFFEIKTNAATVLLPANMFTGTGMEIKDNVQLSINSSMPDGELREKLGDQPIYDFSIAVDGKEAAWNNPDAAVKVAIPYSLSADETDAEFVVVWYIDPEGNIMPVTNGHYDADSGEVVFTTSHFSRYVVTYLHKTFADVASSHWAKHAIDVLASKGVLNGVSADSFMPDRPVSRADFTIMLVKALGLTANVDTNFADVKPSDYYYREVGIARKLGIVQGFGNGAFLPKQNISREEMFVMIANALSFTNMHEHSGQIDTSVLAAFKDSGRISPYAKNSIASLVQLGIVSGDGSMLKPNGRSTRAEAAMVIYKLINLH